MTVVALVALVAVMALMAVVTVMAVVAFVATAGIPASTGCNAILKTFHFECPCVHLPFSIFKIGKLGNMHGIE